MSRASHATCPHCDTRATKRTSRKITEITREAYFQCNNIECGHTWVALISAIRTIVPSRTPNPKVYIPISDRALTPESTPPPTG